METRRGKGKVMSEAASETAGQLPTAPVQLMLLGDSGPALIEDEADDQVIANRGAGRPAGAINRATREFRDYILARHRSPLVTLARLQSADPLELAKQLGCKPQEALDRIIRAAECLAPYLHQKQAIAVDVSNTKTVFLTINDGHPVVDNDDSDSPIIDIIDVNGERT